MNAGFNEVFLPGSVYEQLNNNMARFSACDNKLTDIEIINSYSSSGKYHVMLDGIINQQEFSKASYKILWILKEPYGALPKHISCGFGDRITGNKNDSNRTWRGIALTSYGILTSRVFAEEPIWREYGKSLNEIAIINLKKTAGQSSTSMNNLASYFKNGKYNDIILRQLDDIKPDIVIGGNTLHILQPFLGECEDLKYGHFFCNKVLFINTYHPAQRKIAMLEYANKIINRVWEYQNEQ